MVVRLKSKDKIILGIFDKQQINLDSCPLSNDSTHAYENYWKVLLKLLDQVFSFDPAPVSNDEKYIAALSNE